MSNQNTNVEYKHTLGSWAAQKPAAEIEKSVNSATSYQLGPWARGEVDASGNAVAPVAEKPKGKGKGKGKGEPSAPAGEPDASDDDDKALNGETPAAPLVS